MNLRFYLFVSGVNQGNGERTGDFRISLCYPRGLGTFPEFYCKHGGGIQCLWSICRWLMVFSFCSIGSRCQEWNLHSFSNWTLGSRYWDSHSAGSQSLVLSADSQSGEPQLEFYGRPIFDSCFMNFVFRISGGMKFWDLSWGLRHWRSEFDCRSDRMLTIIVPIPICELCLKNDDGEAESIIK